jgi:uncharacterized protein (TIGR03435 family)
VNASVAIAIHQAYPTALKELTGAPDWVTSDPYDIDAKTDRAATPEDLALMLRSLLEERFKLTLHVEKVERPVFSLIVARNDRRLGAGLIRSSVDCEAVRAARREGRKPDAPAPSNGAPLCGWSSSNQVVLRFGGAPLSRLAEGLGKIDDRLIVDKTGLVGNYEFTLHYTMQADPPGDTPFVFTALEEQLGLRLVPDRASLDRLMIDHIERPTEN